MKECFQFGILGCGVISGIHKQAVEMLPRAEFAGAADYDGERAKKFVEGTAGAAYGSYEEMLQDPAVDAVCICTPSGWHCENAIAALRAGKHVVLEKPMAISTEDADRIEAVCKETGKLLTVICQLRFSRDVQRVKKLMEEQAFGAVSLCSLNMKEWRAPSYYAGTWRGTRAMDGGGALMNQGIHGVDLMLYLMGDAKLKYGKAKTSFHYIEVEDTAVAVLEFENGALGTMDASTCAYPGFRRRLEIVGSEGCAIFNENKLERLVVHGVEQDLTEEEKPVETSPLKLAAELHVRQIGNLIGAIRGEETLLIDAAQGRRAVALIEQIYRFPG